MKKLKIILKKVILILCIFLIIVQNTVYGATEEEFQNAIASFCYNFYKESGASTRYDYGTAGLGVNEGQSENYARKQAYKGIQLSGTGHNENGDPSGTPITSPDKGWFFDCVGFVSFAIHNSVGMGNDDWTEFALPTCYSQGKYGTNGFEMTKISNPTESDLKPGDVVQSSNHVMLYVGDIDNSGKGSIIHCDGWGGPGGPSNEAQEHWGVRCQYFQDACAPGQRYAMEAFCRVKPDELSKLDASQFNTNGEKLSVGENSASDNGNSGPEIADFYYNGIPDGKYSVTKSFWERLIDSLSGIFDFLIGLMTMGIRMVFVGWTAIFENLLTITLESITGGSDIETISVTSTDIESGDNISIEKIVFNQIGIFDVNFFNYNDEDPELNGESQTDTP